MGGPDSFAIGVPKAQEVPENGETFLSYDLLRLRRPDRRAIRATLTVVMVALSPIFRRRRHDRRPRLKDDRVYAEKLHVFLRAGIVRR